MNTFRVANWNLDGYKSDASSRLPGQVAVLQALNADVLVLTEVRDTTRIPGMTFWWSDQGQAPYSPQDRAVGIASQWPGRTLKVKDGRLSVCVAFDAPSPLGTVLVYGTIIPYKLDGVQQKAATAWERHRKAVADVIDDMNQLQSDPSYRDATVILAGDFNTSLDGSNWYGDVESRARLMDGLTHAGLRCHTLEDIRATRNSDRAIVDHIWSTQNVSPSDSLHVWCDRKEPRRLSDHNGVALQLEKVRRAERER